MIEVLSGHLASGRWRIKKVDGIPLLSHLQAFSRRPEYRIGPDQLRALDIKSQTGKKALITLHFVDDTYCTARATTEDLSLLQEIVLRHETAPIAVNSQRPWIIGMCIFFSAWILFELLHPLFI